MRRFSWRSAGDLAVIGAFAVLVVAGGVFAVRSGGSPARAATAAAAELLSVAALTVRRRYPLPVLAAVIVFGTVAAMVADRTIIGPLLPALALYTLAAVSTWQATLWAAVAAFGCYGTGELAGHTREPAQLAVLAAVLLIAATIGLYAGEHRTALAAVSERAEQAERERLLLAAQAVLAERVWIARELHDAIGHHVSLLVVQAGAVRSALPDDHPTHAVLTSMIDGGREAMTEMRRLVDVLRPLDDGDADDGSDLGPPPGLDDLPGLCDRLRAGGLPVHLDLDVPAPPPRTAGITAYRIVQEALTNVVKHAGQVPTRVQIRGDERRLDLRVTNGPPSGTSAAGLGSGGHGLDGIRRRIALFGGEVFAGPVPGGGYALRATLHFQERP
ncbi:MAG: Two component signal transduction histidine kinase [Actinomycetia bacterium]|nr:Two component signal transduction histidine kinase [Actinomycetes bacterium]